MYRSNLHGNEEERKDLCETRFGVAGLTTGHTTLILCVKSVRVCSLSWNFQFHVKRMFVMGGDIAIFKTTPSCLPFAKLK